MLLGAALGVSGCFKGVDTDGDGQDDKLKPTGLTRAVTGVADDIAESARPKVFVYDGDERAERLTLGVGFPASLQVGVDEPLGLDQQPPDQLTVEVDGSSEVRVVEDPNGFDPATVTLTPKEPGTETLHIDAQGARANSYTYDVCAVDHCEASVDFPFHEGIIAQSGDRVVAFTASYAPIVRGLCFAISDCQNGGPLRADVVMDQFVDGALDEPFAGGRMRYDERPQTIRLESELAALEVEFELVDFDAVAEIVPAWDVSKPLPIDLGWSASLELMTLTVEGERIYGDREYEIEVSGAELEFRNSSDRLWLEPKEAGTSFVTLRLGDALLDFEVETTESESMTQ